jgi:hypothetical protein
VAACGNRAAAQLYWHTQNLLNFYSSDLLFKDKRRQRESERRRNVARPLTRVLTLARTAGAA